MPIISQLKSLPEALAAAVHFLARRPPFDGFGFGAMALSLDSQIKRGTYAFAIDGSKVIGYMGWTLLDHVQAESFAERGQTPRFDDAGGQDVVWLLVVASQDKATLQALLRAGRQRYSGKTVMGVRYKGNSHRVVFRGVVKPL
jgi:hemolysin-activating ACP:hemolysin acyltransferase